MFKIETAPSLLTVATLCAPLAAAQTKENVPVEVQSSHVFEDVKGTESLDPAWLAAAAARDAADLAGQAAAPRAKGGAGSKAAQAASAFHRSAMTEVVYDAAADGIWALGRGWKAHFGQRGVEYIPRLGKAAPQNYPTRFELREVRIGGADLPLRAAEVQRTADGVALDHGSVREVYHAAPDALEQTFVFTELPAFGDLVVDISVASAWQVIPGDDVIRFVDPFWGELTYGRAFVLDAAGNRAEIARDWTGDGIRMTVPASFLADAVLPLTIDPIIGGTFNNNQGVNDDDSQVDGAWDSSSMKLWFVWQDYTSATDADIFLASLDGAGTFSANFAVDLSSNYWDTPAIAASPATQRVMVVASATTNGPGTSVADIVGRIIDTAAGSVGSLLTIDTQSQSCVHPDLGGSWDTIAGSADFCVVYEREFSATDHDILARVINTDGTFLTNVIFLSNSTANNDFAPAISKSRGDESFAGDYWNVAWIRDADGDGRGMPMTQRIYFNGQANGSVEQVVLATQLASHVDVSSTFDSPVSGTSERPYVVVYERAVSGGDIFAVVCTQSATYNAYNVSIMEDFDSDLSARRPSVATDGTSFFITYEELYYAAPQGSDDFDVFAVSGNLWSHAGVAGIALGERHQAIWGSFQYDALPIVTSEWDGGTDSDDAWMLWVEVRSPQGGIIGIRGFDSATVQGSAFQSIGSQYCRANGHNESGSAGRESSFISARGSASVGAMQRLECVDMKRNAFAYFIVSGAVGNVNLAGGSAGRLCLGGAIGRQVGGSILNSGSAGAVSILFNPLALPSPTGPFAATPGQTLYFQCWHRDTTPGGAATSNFSNACSVVFKP